MLVADFEPIDMSAPEVHEDRQFMHGLLYTFVLSIPLWGAIIALVRFVL